MEATRVAEQGTTEAKPNEGVARRCQTDYGHGSGAFYLRHLRSCAADASGARGTNCSTAGRSFDEGFCPLKFVLNLVDTLIAWTPIPIKAVAFGFALACRMIVTLFCVCVWQFLALAALGRIVVRIFSRLQTRVGQLTLVLIICGHLNQPCEAAVGATSLIMASTTAVASHIRCGLVRTAGGGFGLRNSSRKPTPREEARRTWTRTQLLVLCRVCHGMDISHGLAGLQ